MRCFALLFLLAFFCLGTAQGQKGFQPAECYPSDSATVVQSLIKDYETFIKGLPKSTHEKVQEFYKGRHEYEVRSLRRGNLLFSPEIEAYFNNILQEIYRTNPDIPSHSIRLFVSRVPEPNASSLGDGVLMFNIGLLSRLENESQVAFILCHEIAHYKLNHAEESLRKYIETSESKKTQKELDNISKLESGVYQQASALLQTIVYDDRRSSRRHEREADALGLKYLRNTRYDAQEALRCMEILETIDEEKYPDSLDLRSCLQTPSYPFKDEWLRMEGSSLAFSEAAVEKDETFNPDSLRTHPDCPERLRLMQDALHDYSLNAPPKNYQPESLLREMALQADYEIVESYYHYGLSGDCLYHALKLLRQYPGDPYLQGKIGISLYMINRALIEHNLDEQVPLPSPKMEPNYKRFVEFVHKLRSKELARLGYYYLNDRIDLPKDNEDVLCALALAAKMMDKADEFSQRKSRYFEYFPNGRYKEILDAQ